MAELKIGVIGGTGLYQIEDMNDIEEIQIKTPFGPPSDALVLGTLDRTRIAVLPRHGKGHRISPSELPSQANIYALKSLGVEWIIAINSAGSFKEEIRPMDLVIPDQIIDRTKGRTSTFFGGGLVVHTSFADPFCPVLSDILYRAAQSVGARVHKGGTYLAMEGPQFSTRAESRLYRSWGASIIGMTILPEAKLAREAEICYASIACVSDYDSWRPHFEAVTADTIIDIMRRNSDTAKRIIRSAIAHIPEKRECECVNALKTAIVTTPESIPLKVKKELALLIGKYVQ